MEKMFKLSNDYVKLRKLLKSGKKVKVLYDWTNFFKTKYRSLTYIKPNKYFNVISQEQFNEHMKNQNLEFFDELEETKLIRQYKLHVCSKCRFKFESRDYEFFKFCPNCARPIKGA